jgi:hypothetical protein
MSPISFIIPIFVDTMPIHPWKHYEKKKYVPQNNTSALTYTVTFFVKRMKFQIKGERYCSLYYLYRGLKHSDKLLPATIERGRKTLVHLCIVILDRIESSHTVTASKLKSTTTVSMVTRRKSVITKLEPTFWEKSFILIYVMLKILVEGRKVSSRRKFCTVKIKFIYNASLTYCQQLGIGKLDRDQVTVVT